MIVAYLRVSTNEQAESGLGLDAQLEQIETAFGKPDHIFKDEGISGRKANRPGLESALQSLQKGDSLCVAKRDRLARDTFLALWIEKEAKKRGGKILSAAGEGNGDSPTDKLLRDIINAFAAFESERIGERVSDAWQQQRKRGKKCGGDTPYGFAVDDQGYLEPQPQEQDALALMRDLRASGASYRAIGLRLEKMQIQTKRGGKNWHPQTVKQVLHCKQGA